MTDDRSGEIVIASYGSGDLPADELNPELARAWRNLLQDPEGRARAGEALNVDPAQLETYFPGGPFQARKAPGQGLGALETAVLIFVVDVAYDVLKDLTKDAARDGLRKLWSLVKGRVGAGALGGEAKPAADDNDSTQQQQPES